MLAVLALVQAQDWEEHEDTLSELFDHFDQDGDGTLSPRDYVLMMQQVLEGVIGMTSPLSPAQKELLQRHLQRVAQESGKDSFTVRDMSQDLQAGGFLQAMRPEL